MHATPPYEGSRALRVLAVSLAGALFAIAVDVGAASASIQVRDDADNVILLQQPARRVVTLAPSQAELVVAAGAAERIVGVSSFTDDPVLAPGLPVVAAAGRVDIEHVVQLAPDLIVAWQSGNRVRDIERLRQLGFVVFVTEPRRLADIARLIRTLGVVIGTEAPAERNAVAFESQIAALRVRPAGSVRTFVALWHQPLITVNGSHLIADAMRMCGAHNVFADLPLLAPRVSAEQLLAANPQLIIASGGAAEQTRIVEAFAAFKLVDAVRNARVVVVDPTLFQRQSPRMVEGIRAICAAVAGTAS